MAPLAAPGQEEPLHHPGKQFRNQLVAAVRRINWSYAIFWSITPDRPGALTWKDGFYNGEIKTRKVIGSADDLTAGDQLVLRRSEQLRELHESLLSGDCDHQARRPVGSLSPEDLGDTEWYYMISMTYAFRSGQGLPGKCFASNKYVWLCHAQLADTKAFQRALLATNKSVQTVVCIPLAGGALELGTTRHVLEDPDLVNRIETSFCREQRRGHYPSTALSSGPSANKTGGDLQDVDDVIMVQDDDSGGGGDDLRHDDAVEAMDTTNLERVTKEMGGGFSCNSGFSADELGARWLDEDDGWLMITDLVSVEAMSLIPDQADDAVVFSGSVDQEAAGSSFTAWKGSTLVSGRGQVVAVPVVAGGEQSQKLLKKAVAAGGGAWPWTDNAAGRRTTTARDQESSIIKKNHHVISERRRREKLSDMILTLKSLVPSIGKEDKASVLAETIAYLKELQQRIRELESAGGTGEESSCQTNGTTGQQVMRCQDGDFSGEKASSGAKRKATCTREDGHGLTSSNVSITVMDKEVLLEVKCRWKEPMMARVFDAVKSLHLDVLSVQASTLDRLLALKMRAKFDGSAVVAPEVISEALGKAIYEPSKNGDR